MKYIYMIAWNSLISDGGKMEEKTNLCQEHGSFFDREDANVFCDELNDEKYYVAVVRIR